VERSSGRAAVRLHLLHRAAEGEASGLSVSEELGRHGYRISPGTLYPLLHGLEAEGLLASAERTENSGILRYYAATEAAGHPGHARRALAELAADLLPAPEPTTATAPRKRRT